MIYGHRLQTAPLLYILIVGMDGDKSKLKELGNKVRHLRTSLGLTQTEFSTKVGVNKNYIGMLERGERNPSYLMLVKISNNLPVPLRELIP